ncbi:BQ2448_6650 [Microbotryum intermedium]|uniref:BQ2448_6650 protein n=1 Tax=Microbotryum intermedium TaxID=269621 RepID=A0A238FSK6_9BASI|nr:BQ2448_6650 [Microbotryum intermedium]
MSGLSSTPTTAIQSIFVPSHSLRLTPAPAHIVYRIDVTTPSRIFSVSHRYSAFVQLVQDLQAENAGHKLPLALPSRRGGSSIFSFVGVGGGSGSNLSEAQLVQRRQGLETFLRGLLADNDRRWASSKAFKEFLAAPSMAEEEGSAFTPLTWMTEQQSLVILARELRATFAKRDALLLQRDHSAHATGQEGKRGLVSLVVRLGTLTKGLAGLAKTGLPQGELQRRGDLIAQLQDETETLGKLAAAVPRVSAASAGKPEESVSVQRGALLGARSATKPAARVLGQPVETAETRPLDNAGLMQLQQQYVAKQDDKLDSLTAALRRQRALGEMISQELSEQEELLDHLDKGLDKTGGKLKSAEKLMKKL